jgi:hypothetical protein
VSCSLRTSVDLRHPKLREILPLPQHIVREDHQVYGRDSSKLSLLETERAGSFRNVVYCGFLCTLCACPLKPPVWPGMTRKKNQLCVGGRDIRKMHRRRTLCSFGAFYIPHRKQAPKPAGTATNYKLRHQRDRAHLTQLSRTPPTSQFGFESWNMVLSRSRILLFAHGSESACNELSVCTTLGAGSASPSL